MTKIAVDLDKETKVVGDYNHLGDWYGYPYYPVQRISTPIPAGKDFLSYVSGGEYEWVPDAHADKVEITPHCVPDIVACGFGGGLDSFGVKWIPNASSPDLPAFVQPGLITLDDVTRWRDLTFPDVDSWNWEEEGRQSKEFYSGDDRSRRGVIMIGFFERMISIMGFENAAVSFITDPDETKEFLDAIADVNIRIADHYIDDFGCDSILVHDDWSSQLFPFFSLDTVMEFLVPPMKKVVDHVHSRGALCMHHSCGNGTTLAPAYRATGTDLWQAQVEAIDLDTTLEGLAGDVVLEIWPTVPDDMSDEDVSHLISEMLERTKRHRFLCELIDNDPERCYRTRLEYYRQARLMAASGESA